MVVIAFATVYLVWGSTYFFIQKAIQHIPALIMGGLRFLAAGILMMLYCIFRGENIWNWRQIKPAIVSGLLLLLIGNGAVIWAEQSLPSSLVAVLVSAAPFWFVLLDKSKWQENFSSRETIMGLIFGFIGVILLFSEQVAKSISVSGGVSRLLGFILLILGSMSWAGGSLYSKYRTSGSAIANTTWQMITAGLAFIPLSFIHGEWTSFDFHAVTTDSWMSLLYLVTMGSLAGYSAYVWLLQVRPATQVSTYAYVNPVVAVLLGAFFAGEKISLIQVTGLAVILVSVLLINLSKYRKERQSRQPGKERLNETKEIDPVSANKMVANCSTAG